MVPTVGAVQIFLEAGVAPMINPMNRAQVSEADHEMAFESFGVRVAVAAISKTQLERIRAILPPGWQPCDPKDAQKRFTIEVDPLKRWVITRDGDPVNRAGLEFDHVLLLLESQMRSFVALMSPDLIFVHAGAVALGDRLLVMPGYSFAGKTTLVAALVQAGAVYYSDEYALLDEEGLVHAYPRPLSLRNPDRTRVNTPVGEIGGTAGEDPLRIGQIVVTTYKPGSEWQPRELSPGESVLAMLSHTVAAQTRPEQVMRHITRAVDGAVAIESSRGDAESVVPLLLDELRV